MQTERTDYRECYSVTKKRICVYLAFIIAGVGVTNFSDSEFPFPSAQVLAYHHSWVLALIEHYCLITDICSPHLCVEICAHAQQIHILVSQPGHLHHQEC